MTKKRRSFSQQFKFKVAMEALKGLEDYLCLYDYERPHQGLSYRTPAEIYNMSRESAGIPLETHLKYIVSWSSK